MTNNSLGIFDSGVGGTSIWKEINSLLPNENTIYLADSKNAPYGLKSKNEIIQLCEKNTELLLNADCKLIVVACNTATTNAISHLRTKYKVPFIGIEPAIKPASLKSQTKSIGILATKGTLSSELFQETSSIYSNGINVIEQEGIGIVELIESGKLFSKDMESLLNKYLQPMIKENIDYLVLGCSHYPYLIPMLKKMLPNGVQIIDSGLAVASQTKRILQNSKKLNENSELGNHTFYTNAKPQILKEILGSEYNVHFKEF